MQKEITKSKLLMLIEYIRIVFAWLFLGASWITLAISIKNLIRAIYDFGVFNHRFFLSAEFGYFGIFSFGLASIAILFSPENLKRNKKLFWPFNVALFVSLIIVFPIFLFMALLK